MPKSQSARREEAIRRGLESLYREASGGEGFDVYGFDMAFCFHCIASTSSDAKLRRAASRMGRDIARRWRRAHPRVPPDADADDVAQLVFGSDAADRFGPRDASMKRQIREAAAQFTPADYFWFDPVKELPPLDVPDDCACGAGNVRGRKRCWQCGKKLPLLGPYGVFLVALIRTYLGERYGVRLGASHDDVLKLLPAMRPYPLNEGRDDTDFYWAVYAVTHVVYTLNDYGARRLSPRLLPVEYEFLKDNLGEPISDEDPETVGECLDSLKAFGLGDSHPLIREGTEFLLSSQNADGSWGEQDTGDAYVRYHGTFTAINGLRDYAWRGGKIAPSKRKLLLSLSGV